MKKLHSINWYYLVGTLPFVLAIASLSAILMGRTWQKVLIAAAGCAVAAAIVRKFWCLPRPEKSYGTLEPYDLDLPDYKNVSAFLCPQMDQYGFLKRNVELISPLVKRPGTKFKIVVSPEFKKTQGDGFVRIAVMREIVRYRQAAQVKASLGLVTPVLLLVSLAEAYFALGWWERYPIAPGYISFFGPLLLAVVFVCFVLVWNKNMSRIDYKADDELKKYFTKGEIADYIERWDKLLLPDEPELINEKSRQLELFYIEQRIARL